MAPLFDGDAFLHARDHSFYFDDRLDDSRPNHPVVGRLESSNLTICADQIRDSLICRLYERLPLARFLALATGKHQLHTMADPLARMNVMAYGAEQQLNWRLDRSAITTTLLLQEPTAGGVFEYRSGLRSKDDANPDGVADLLRGRDAAIATLPLAAGTLSVFRGRNTAHRVTPVQSDPARMVGVCSYYERPGVVFGDEERIDFYGQAA